MNRDDIHIYQKKRNKGIMYNFCLWQRKKRYKKEEYQTLRITNRYIVR